jgi:acyl carrier protein
METEQMLAEINKIFITVMDNEDIRINAATAAKDIEEWDSLTHIQLIVAVEKHFKIKFTSQEIRNFNCVGDMCVVIKQKLG